MSLVLRKPAFCICENKDADQLRGIREADQRLCFRYMESTIPLLPKFEISSLLPSSVTAQPDLCRTWSETPKTGFLRTRLISSRHTEGGNSTDTDTKTNKHREPNQKYRLGTVSNIQYYLGWLKLVKQAHNLAFSF